MRYLATAISFTAKKPHYLLLFIMFSSLGFPVSVMKQLGVIKGVSSVALMIVTFALSTFFISGVYSLTWKNLKGMSANFITDAKKYFSHVLGVSIVMGIMGFFGIMACLMINKTALSPDIPAEIYNKSLNANLTRSLPAFFVTVLFVYSFPAIFVCNLSGKEAIAKSWTFLTKNISKSRVVISLLLFSSVSRMILTQWAVTFDYSSSNYWEITSFNNFLTYTLAFLTFLTASQIFEEFYKEKEITYQWHSPEA